MIRPIAANLSSCILLNRSTARIAGVWASPASESTWEILPLLWIRMKVVLGTAFAGEAHLRGRNSLSSFKYATVKIDRFKNITMYS